MAVLLRKVLGIGKLPDDMRAEVETEGVIHLAEFVPVTFRFSGHVPGKVAKGNIRSYVGALVLTDQRVLGMRSRCHARLSRPGWLRVPFICGIPAIAPQGFAGGGGGMFTTGTVGLKDRSRSAIWPWRAKSIDSPRMRAASCGAWKPVEFSAST